jgi:uncharacterized protein YecE (DUF72 family)
MAPVRIGCSGWQYASWRDRLYPKGLGQPRWLQRYAEVFDTVEVNSTFYRLARPDAVRRWVEQTPEDFLFTIKGSRYLTHIKRLRDMDQGVSRFYESIEPLARSPKMGPVLWQLPENFHRDDDVLRNALQGLPDGRHCFEFRHESWFKPEVYELLRAHDVALVIGDHPARPFQTYEMTADFTFVRFHWGKRGRRGNYSRTELDAWAERIAEWSRQRTVFAYFNNDWEGFAVKNGVYLKRRLVMPPAQPSSGAASAPVAAGATRASERTRSDRRSRAA